jgi:imidazoleglycerol-phosphate dehydratase / histidinol-phosphatase
MKKILFIDRDGTLVEEPKDTFQINSLEELIFLKNVISSLKEIFNSWYELVIVTNQDWLWTKLNPRETYEKVNKKIFEIFASEWIEFSHIFECPHFENENCLCRKPKVWILWNFLNENEIDYKNSYMVWDRDSDMEFAKNIWVKWLKINNKEMTWEKIKKILTSNLLV